MQFQIPHLPLTINVPNGWEATPTTKVLYVHAPGAGKLIGTIDFMSTPSGEFSLFPIEVKATDDLSQICKQLWKHYTGISEDSCEPLIKDKGIVSFEWTDGVADIISWIVKPSVAPYLTLEIQYSIDGYHEPKLSSSERDAILNQLISSLTVLP